MTRAEAERLINAYRMHYLKFLRGKRRHRAEEERAFMDAGENIIAALVGCRASAVEECAGVVDEWANEVERKAPQSPTILQARMHATQIRALSTQKSTLSECRAKMGELQELAIWMTGCGFDFAALPYFQEKRHLFTWGVDSAPAPEAR
jgi:hypothetical protein